MTAERSFLYIDGYWKDDGMQFTNYKVSEFDDYYEGINEWDDSDVFHYDLPEEEVKLMILQGENNGEWEFVITNYSK